MKTEPVILRSLSSKDSEVKCTFERPYVFLNDPTTARGKKYKILDFADCKSSQIVIRGMHSHYHRLSSTIFWSFSMLPRLKSTYH